MAYGFGATFGTGASDRIATSVAPGNGARTIFIRSLRNGNGGGGFGRYWDAGIYTGRQEACFFDSANNRLQFQRTFTSGAVTAGWYITAPASGSWHTLGISYDPSSTANDPAFYLNGVSQSVTELTAPSGTADDLTNTVAIGNRPSDNARAWDGKHDRYYEWNVILNATEHAQLAAGTDPATIRPGNLRVAMRMLDNATDTVGGSTTVNGAKVVSGPETSVSADSTTSYSVTASSGTTAVSADSTASYSILAVTTTLSSPEDRGSINLALSAVTNASTTTPTVKAYPRRQTNDYNDGSTNAKAYFFYGRVDGVNGKTPAFKVQMWSSSTHTVDTALFTWHYQNALPSTYRPMWSYDARTWNFFDNSAWDADGLHRNFSNNAAFAGDTVYFASALPWQDTKTPEWLATLSGNSYIAEPASAVAFGGDDYQFGTCTARTNELGETIAATKLYAVKVSSGTGNAPDGYPKRKIVLFGGTHAGEDPGTWAVNGAVEWAASGDAKAVTLRQWFDVFAYPLISTAGRRGGHWRSDFDSANIMADMNRHWGSNTLETVAKHRAAIATDTGNDIAALVDYHAGHMGVPYLNIHTANKSTFVSALSAYRPGVTANDFTPATASTTWAVASLGAEFGICPEVNWGNQENAAYYEAWGADQLKALSDIAASGFWEITPVSADRAASYLIRGAASADTSPTYDIRAAVVGDLASAYDIQTAGAVVSSSTADYAIRGSVSSDVSAAYSLHAAVAADAHAVYALRSAVTANLTVSYSVDANDGTVVADLTALYVVDGLVVYVRAPSGSGSPVIRKNTSRPSQLNTRRY